MPLATLSKLSSPVKVPTVLKSMARDFFVYWSPGSYSGV
jgi:hypothetical protein